MQSSHQSLLREILIARGYDTPEKRRAFMEPKYDDFRHDPFLLPDMLGAVERLVTAQQLQQKVVIYGDYDIDGLTATTVLLDAFEDFGIKASSYMPNRFVEGYGLSSDAVKKIAEDGAQLIVTVDCGSLSHKEIELANQLSVDVIVTDHHNVAEIQPAAIAVVNPKRLLQDYPDSYKDFMLIREDTDKYPFVDLAGVGVAFKLVQALQTRLEGLDKGQEKWLLDLVALGTVCDVVTLRDENRANVRWGLEVMKKTRRPGLRALMAVSRIKPAELTARSLGFGLGPRMNAAGRLETAQHSLDLLRAQDSTEALEIAEKLDLMNTARRKEQDRIFVEASKVAEELNSDPVLIVSSASWSHGIIGIVAAKLLEKYHKPTFVLQELEDGTAKGSARSFGDFSAVDGIRATEKHLIKGGGHKLAAGVTIMADKIAVWREAINDYYKSLKIQDQLQYLLPDAAITLEGFERLNEQLIQDIDKLEPYGNGNPTPVFKVSSVEVIGRRTMGDRGQHVKYSLSDKSGNIFSVIAFNKADDFSADIGDMVEVWIELTLNEWQGRRTVEGRLLRLTSSYD